ncbi:MAG TPA: hypothetical protein ENJ08_02735 [Gammaproteobacteria bacterium]|nr:hypothetical protein [Gammaproteobacteria bacterium]
MLTNKQEKRTVKYRLLTAVLNAQIGRVVPEGAVVNTKQFRRFFNTISSLYSTAFLPATVIEEGRCGVSHTRYATRLRRGVYLIHKEALKEHARLLDEEGVDYIMDILETKENDVSALI